MVGAEPKHEEDKALGLRVLLVDDNEMLRRPLRRLLELGGHAVTEASSGKQALELVGSSPFDAVLSDVQMPDGSGVELLQAIHEREPELPVFLMSGAPDLESAMRAVKVGATEYLIKPIDFPKLRESMTKAHEQRQKLLEDRRASAARSGTRFTAT